MSHVRCKNQFANLGHSEKSFNLLLSPMKGPTIHATKLARTPELK